MLGRGMMKGLPQIHMTDGSVSVWDSTTGTTVKRPFKAGSRWGNVFVSSIAFSPDRLYLVSGLSDGRIRIRDLMTELETAVGGQKRPLRGIQVPFRRCLSR